jgi:hypothetical protein
VGTAKAETKIASTLALIVMLVSGAVGQQAAPALRGSWTASAGPARVFHGRWTGQVSQQGENAARGSWILLADSGQILLEGTWSSQKNSTGWHGTWIARTVQGRSFSGTWKASISDPRMKTFGDMLKRSLEEATEGTWQSGPYKGHWQLRGPE